MKKLLTICFCLLLSGLLNAQVTKNRAIKSKIFLIIVENMDGKKIRGYVHSVDENQLLLKDEKAIPTSIPDYLSLHSFQVNEIKTIAIRKKNGIIKSMSTGAALGAFSGVAIGLISGSDQNVPEDDFFAPIVNAFNFSAGEKAIFGGIMLGTAGAAVGVISEIFQNKKYKVNGDKKEFSYLIPQLIAYIPQR